MSLFFELYGDHRDLHVLTHSFPTRRSSDLPPWWRYAAGSRVAGPGVLAQSALPVVAAAGRRQSGDRDSALGMEFTTRDRRVDAQRTPVPDSRRVHPTARAACAESWPAARTPLSGFHIGRASCRDRVCPYV